MAITFSRRRRMGAAWAVTGFTLNIRELRSGNQRLEPALIKSDDMTAHTFVIKLLVFAL